MDGVLDEILRNLEENERKEEIEKYKEMRAWRLKRDKTVRD